MKLFGKKKGEETLPRPPVPLPRPGAPLPPPGPQAAKRTLAQDIGLDDFAELPPLPPIAAEDAAPMPTSRPLPPMPAELGSAETRTSGLSLPAEEGPDLSELPPLPISRPLPPMPKAAPAPAGPQPRAPVFIRLDKYNEIISTVDQMEARINDLQGAIKKINEVKEKEKEIIDSWTGLINEAKERIDKVNEKLPEA